MECIFEIGPANDSRGIMKDVLCYAVACIGIRPTTVYSQARLLLSLGVLQTELRGALRSLGVTLHYWLRRSMDAMVTFRWWV